MGGAAALMARIRGKVTDVQMKTATDHGVFTDIRHPSTLHHPAVSTASLKVEMHSSARAPLGRRCKPKRCWAGGAAARTDCAVHVHTYPSWRKLGALAGTWLTWLASSRRAEMIRRGEVVRHSRDSRRSRCTLDELPREMRMGTNEEDRTPAAREAGTNCDETRRDATDATDDRCMTLA